VRVHAPEVVWVAAVLHETVAAVAHETVAAVAVVVVEIVEAEVVAVVDNTGDVDGDVDGGAIVLVVVLVVVPVIAVDDACSLKQNSWNDSQLAVVAVAAAVDHIRIRTNVVERLHKRFVLTFVDVVEDIGVLVVVVVVVHGPLHHCSCSCYNDFRWSLGLSSV
jgi:hypothetical protein